MPAAIPAATPLTSMRVAYERLARESPPELGERLVVDRRQVADLEGPLAASLDARLERANDLRVELGALVLVQLVDRSIMTRRLAVDAIGRHGLIRIGHEQDP